MLKDQSRMCEVVEEKTGFRVAHTNKGELMSTTLFDNEILASTFIVDKGLQLTHFIRPLQKGNAAHA